ncbi:hypothetical protein N7485_010825 [Penicillium canescens]|nr:hypothetical protein N7485_010825 [Penicillium canescens]
MLAGRALGAVGINTGLNALIINPGAITLRLLRSDTLPVAELLIIITSGDGLGHTVSILKGAIVTLGHLADASIALASSFFTNRLSSGRDTLPMTNT